MRGWLVALALMGCAAGDGKDTSVVPEPEPGELIAGFAAARIPAPVGIGTAGFGPFGAPASESPFSDIYPATRAVFGHPEVKVMVLSRGEGFEAVFIRLDAVGMFAQLRQEVVREISDRLGRDMDDAVLIGATHTHSGPGRVLNSGTVGSSFFDIVVDKFLPEFYTRFVDAIADAVEAAYADARPARLGTSVGTCTDGHNDRRCEDGETYTNSALPLLAVERDGTVDGLLMAYAVHGTVLGIDQLHLSQDVSGAIETAVEDRFDHPVPVIMFNSWGADMSPGDPAIETRPAGVRDPAYDRMWRVGAAVADAVDAALGELEWTDTPDIRLDTRRIPIDREKIGYEEGVFEYEYGGVYCGTETGSCEAPGRVDGLDTMCVPFFENFPAPVQVDVTQGWIGPYAVTTFPGEPGTRLAEKIMDGIAAIEGQPTPVLFLGYTQDYLGYSILEDDWWHGGYEAGGALWGPRQGEYLTQRLIDAWAAFAGEGAFGEERGVLEPFPYTVDSPYAPSAAVDAGAVLADAADVAADGVITFSVAGEDPWLGAPRLRVETEAGEVVTRPGGWPLDGDDQNFDLALSVEPPWEEEAAARTFRWTWRFSPRSPLVDGIDLSGQRIRLVATVPQAGGGEVEVRSAVVGVE